MSDPRIKLFGRTIRLPERFSADSGIDSNQNGCFSGNPQTGELVEEQSLKSRCFEMKGHSQPLVQVDLKGNSLRAPLTEDPNGPFSANHQPSNTDEQQEVGVSQEKSFKKPERILPCPRCNSMDTKFCYYNNYNTNQPRHFCKNCQRYWTAGGTMRNVPVGAGRRKNKGAVAQFRHAIPEALQKVRVDHSTGLSHPGLKANGNGLKFISDAPLCESLVSSLSIGDKKSVSGGFSQTGEQECSVSPRSKEGRHDHPIESSIAIPKGVIGKRDLQEQFPSHPFPSQVACFPGAPWPYPCHSVGWNSPTSANTFAFAGFPMPSSYSTTPQFMRCSIPSCWTGPWIIPSAPMPPCSGTSSPTLGKHSRDDRIMKSANFGEETLKENPSEQILWVPKTSRIDDPAQLTKTSILSNLGIKEDGADSIGVSSSSLFKSFKGQSKNQGAQDVNSSAVLQANPAALSRALSFHETS